VGHGARRVGLERAGLGLGDRLAAGGFAPAGAGEPHSMEDEEETGRVSGERPGAKDPDSGSNEKLPGEPNPDDDSPLGDTDQHSEVPSEGPTR
jgi:hypothetical protein